ncbi:putative acyl-CoA dehydrogenase [Aspergillus mulundensis]|uniref:Acyl-CoA dehydrogenase n=1 Tax=Aspergillus mulundensis TaxID=1810919 RepID=A0A3D8SBD6_9EURO|nr:hypothetical protein DSM5745_03993 [Aspergillus mulundensis]RDW83667.1 hypothetical protein DSM5745_03993 [Aspergillus mulundensis]
MAPFPSSTPSPTPTPATATSGHFTRPAPLNNTYTSDPSLKRLLEYAERNQPYVKGHNVWGEKYAVDRLVTSEGWKRLGAWGAENGVVALGYEDTYGKERRMAQNYITSPSSGLTSCPASMTDGAALILSNEIAHKNLPTTHSFQTTLRHLVSRGADAWTSGQWMTERAGGSDVQNTETWAVHSPLPTSQLKTQTQENLSLDEGSYLITGFKFFSSATDANIALLLAKTAPAGKLSLFLAPLRRTITNEAGRKQEVSNGVRIHRLKNKLGTKELPTAELELTNMRAHLVGELDNGVQTIAPLLNITRTHTFIGSLAAWRRALDIAKAFARSRTTVGEPLWLIPMHLRLMAELEGRHRGAMELAFFTVAVMGVVENPSTQNDRIPHLPIPGIEATTVFRTLTALSKAVISKMAVSAIQECQEAMGGVGYMDEPEEPEFNISRILRNTAVNCIWEGTSNVLASECVRFLLKAENFGVFGGRVERVLSLLGDGEMAGALREAWKAFRSRFTSLASLPALAVADARRAMFTLAWILSGMLLFLDARRDGDAVTGEIARRWGSGELGVGDTVWRDVVYRLPGPESARVVSEETVRWDCRVAWGVELPRVVGGHRSVKL